MPATPYRALPLAPASTAVIAAARHLAQQLAAVVLYWLWLDSPRRFARAAFDRIAAAVAVGVLFLSVRALAVALILWDTVWHPWITDVLVPFLTAAAVAADQL